MFLLLKLRSRLCSGKIVQQQVTCEGRQLAVIVVDMWNNHWCSGAKQRMDALAIKLNVYLKMMRRLGATIIYSPSGYGAEPARHIPLAHVDFPLGPDLNEPKFPLDTLEDWGCETGEWPPVECWDRQHPGIEVFHEDWHSDNGIAVRGFLAEHGIVYTLLTGVHTNMCVLDADFGARSMVRHGFKVALVRDMGDILYNPAKPPYVSRARGFVLTFRHVEKFICPTIVSHGIMML